MRRAELAESELLTLGAAGVDTIRRHVNDVVSDVESDDRVIDAIVRSDACDDDIISAGTKIEFLELLFHGRLIEAVMGILLDDNFACIGFKILDKFHRRAVLDEGILFTKKGEFGMILRSHRLNVDDFSIRLAKSVQQSSNVSDDGLNSSAMPFAAFSLHVDNDESGPLRRKIDCLFNVHEKPPNEVSSILYRGLIARVK